MKLPGCPISRRPMKSEVVALGGRQGVEPVLIGDQRQ